MKKLIALLAVLVSFFSVAYAEKVFDLSGMSYEELVALKDEINLAIWESDKWQEVEVPQGIWIVGEDIPAGKWTIKHTDGIRYTYLTWSDTLDESGASLSYYGDLYESERIYDPDDKYYEKGEKTEITWELKEGQFVHVEDGIATFTPYAGKPSLGFK